MLDPSNGTVRVATSLQEQQQYLQPPQQQCFPMSWRFESSLSVARIRDSEDEMVLDEANGDVVAVGDNNSDEALDDGSTHGAVAGG